MPIKSISLRLVRVETICAVSELLPEPSTLNAQHSTLNTQHSTLNTQHLTLNTQQSTLNTQHSSLNTQQSTLKIQNSKLNTQHSTLNTHHSTTNPQPPTTNRQRCIRGTALPTASVCPHRILSEFVAAARFFYLKLTDFYRGRLEQNLLAGGEMPKPSTLTLNHQP